MKISIISVCFNEENNIPKTIESVLNQTSDSYEYIICDGKSTDGTVTICQMYEEKFKEKSIDFKVVSEKDGGIYQGMNNGIALANGDYVIFMNAGDKFHDCDVIANIIKNTGCKSPAVVYGDCAYIDRGVYFHLPADHTRLTQEMSICHQSILVRADLIKKLKFNTEFKIGADYDMMLNLYLGGYEFLHSGIIIADFYTGGVSSVNIVKCIEEQCCIKDKYGIHYDRHNALSLAKKSELIIRIKNRIPRFLWKFWNKNIKKRRWVGAE